MKKFLFILLAVLFVLIVPSCATKTAAFEDIDNAVHFGDFEKTIGLIIEAQGARRPLYNNKNVISLCLDMGTLEHYANNFDVSSKNLLEAERFIQEAFTKSLTQGFLTYIANDNAQEYPGEDFEDRKSVV